MKAKNSVLNFISSYIFYFIIIILEFFKIKLFIDYLGENVYSLNQVYVNIFTYLNLMEAGMGSALIYRLYKLLNKKDYDKINKLFSGTVSIFRKIALIMFILGIGISFFIQIFIKDNNFSIIFLSISFILYILRNLIDYCFFVPRYIIMADNKTFKINPLVYSFRILTVLSEIALILLKQNFIVVLLPSVIFSFIQNFVINKKIKKEYVWLEYKKDDKDYSIKNDIKNLFVHKIGNLIFNNVDILLLSKYVGSSVVVIYTAYNLIIKYANDTVKYIYEAIRDAIGNIVATGKENKIKQTISMSVTLYSYISVVIVVVFYFILNRFVGLWLGDSYSVSLVTLVLFLLILYHSVNNSVQQIMINTLGIFKETKWYVILIAIVNFVISFLLVKKYGINGVLFGTVVASYAIESWIYSYIIGKKLFHKVEIRFWFSHHIKNFLLIVCQIILYSWIQSNLDIQILNLFIWFVYAFTICIITFLVTAFMFYWMFPNFKELIYKILITFKSLFVKKGVVK